MKPGLEWRKGDKDVMEAHRGSVEVGFIIEETGGWWPHIGLGRAASTTRFTTLPAAQDWVAAEWRRFLADAGLKEENV